MKELNYNKLIWDRIDPLPVKTLQIFITNRCNLRCKGCFYANQLGFENLSYDYYKSIIKNYPQVSKITLLGGEPAFNPNIKDMVEFNYSNGLKTTIYTNGYKLDSILDIKNTQVRVGVHGFKNSEKPIINIPKTNKKFTIVYMLTKDNLDELNDGVKYIEETYPQVEDFYLSSIRDIGITGSFWKDTEDTISNENYSEIVQSFINNYSGSIKRIHISARGIFKTKYNCSICRFGNIFPDGSRLSCPLDIAKDKRNLNILSDHKCMQGNNCLLQKIILEKK
jgi:MoaA/NifB/PqqE/SkfB family radical SAM enzyme